MKSTLLTVFLGCSLVAPSSQAAWQRLGGLDKRPVNNADANINGTKVSSSNGVGQPENLLRSDPGSASKVPAGASDAVINLGRQVVSNFVTFTNDGAEGRVSVSSSTDQHAWAPLAQAVFTTADRSVQLRFAGVQAKYVKLEFDLSKGGVVRSLGIFGTDTDFDFKIREDKSSTSTTNVSGGLGGGRVIYINPSPAGGDELAEKYNKFDFPETTDKFRTVIYDLGQARTLTEIGSVHSPRPVRLLAYAFEDKLPEKEDWRHRRSFDPAIFDTMKPVAVAEDSRGVGYIKAKLAKSIRVRYVALRWEPDFNPPAFSVSGVSIGASGLGQASYSPGQGGPGAGGPGGGVGNGPGTGGGQTGGGTGGTGAGGGASGSDWVNAAFSNPFNPFNSAGLPFTSGVRATGAGNGKGNQGNGKGNGGPASP